MNEKVNKLKQNYRYLKRRRLLTCAIGASCADGTVIIADKRVMREYEATNESKIQPIGDRMILTGAGTTALLDKLAEAISKSEIAEATDFQKAVETVEDMVHVLKQRYEPRINEDYNFQALIMGLKDYDKGDPYLRLIHPSGFSENIPTFAVIGHGAPYVTPIFKLLYDNMLTVNEIGVLGYFAISTIVCLGIDQTVGCDDLGPDVVVLRTNEKPTFLNPLTPEFEMARKSLNSLLFKYKLVNSIWVKTPQAYQNVHPSLF